MCNHVLHQYIQFQNVSQNASQFLTMLYKKEAATITENRSTLLFYIYTVVAAYHEESTHKLHFISNAATKVKMLIKYVRLVLSQSCYWQ